MKSFLNKAKEKGKLSLELMLLGIAPVAGIALGAKAYQQPPAIVQEASQEKQAPSAPYSQQSAGQYVLVEDMDMNGEAFHRKGEKVPASEVEKIVNNNVYDGGKK